MIDRENDMDQVEESYAFRKKKTIVALKMAGCALLGAAVGVAVEKFGFHEEAVHMLVPAAALGATLGAGTYTLYSIIRLAAASPP